MPVPGYVEQPDRLESSWSEYPSGSDTIRGYLSLPKDGGNGAGVVIIHEAFGVTEHAQDVTRRFANLGYAAICPDLYSRVEMPNEADMNDVMTKMLALPDKQVLADLDASTDLLRRRLGDVARIGCIGFCQGGRIALLAGVLSQKVDAVVSCWGGFLTSANGTDPTTEMRPYLAMDLAKDIRCPLYAAFGADDENPTVEDAHRLERELAGAKVPTQVKIFPDAGHAFLNDTRAHRYQDHQAHALWDDAVRFFGEHLLMR